MNQVKLPRSRVEELLEAGRNSNVLVVGDAMLDHFIWGGVSRISPEAPVPVLDFQRESYMPGGASNVARNLTALGAKASLFSVVGQDAAAHQLKQLLNDHGIGCGGMLVDKLRTTSIKTRVVAHQQQMVRIDRESREPLTGGMTRSLLRPLEQAVKTASAIIVGDYGKGVITQELVDEIKRMARTRAVWVSFDPKPVHRLNLRGLSLITPNRKETFELADIGDETRHSNPLADVKLMRAADSLLKELRPAVLLITLGELGMLLCQRKSAPVHIPTVAQEVFDVSGAGDTVIASFTLAIAAGASPLEAAIFSNHAAGIVVGKVGTATVEPRELLASFQP